MKILVIGGSGFIGKYCIRNLLENGHVVHNLDLQSYELENENYRMFCGDAKEELIWYGNSTEYDVVINFAARLGGINYFVKYPATLMHENELICASVFEQVKNMYLRNKKFKKIIQLSSSMVFESTELYPSIEEDVENIKPPKSVYGFQKLASEFWCKAYHEEFKLPYVVVRPFNAVGLGEDPTKDSHVIPQLIYKVLKGQRPLEIYGKGNQIRVYTHAKDIAEGIRLIVESDKAINCSYNISNEDNEISVLSLARLICQMVAPNEDIQIESIPALNYDVQKRIGSSEKIRKELGWGPQISLEAALYEVISEVRERCLNSRYV